MKTISNPQSIFGGRTFKVSAIDFGAYKPNPTAELLPRRSAMIEGPGSGSDEVGGCFSLPFGEC